MDRTFWTLESSQTRHTSICWVIPTVKTHVSGVHTISVHSTSCHCISEDWCLGWNACRRRVRPIFFLGDSQLPLVWWQYCAPLLRNCEMKLKRPTFSSMTLRLIQRICLWHSCTTCLRTESFLKPFGLQDLRIFLRPIFFFSGVQWKTQCIPTIPTQLMTWRWPATLHNPEPKMADVATFIRDSVISVMAEYDITEMTQ